MPEAFQVPDLLVPAVRKPRLCLPTEWLEAFDDLRLVAVLQAHVEQETAHGALITLSERDCVARTHLDRKTVRKKKRKLIAHGVLFPGASRPGQCASCLIDWKQLRALVEEKGTSWTGEVGEKGTSSAAQVGEKGTSSAAQVGEKGTSWTGEVGEKGTSSAASHNKERAPAPASLYLASYKKLASCVRTAVNETGLRFDGLQMDSGTASNVAAALQQLPDQACEEGLAFTVKRCRHLAKQPGRADSWGFVVIVARDWVAQKLCEMREQASPPPAERKPPQKENDLGSQEAWLEAFPQHPDAAAMRELLKRSKSKAAHA